MIDFSSSSSLLSWSGFFLYRLQFFSCELFKLSVHLWGSGGPNWRREYRQFLTEEELSWSAARRQTSPSFVARTMQCSYAEVAKSPAHHVPLTGANCIPVGTRIRFQFSKGFRSLESQSFKDWSPMFMRKCTSFLRVKWFRGLFSVVPGAYPLGTG